MRQVLPPSVSQVCPGPGKAAGVLLLWGTHQPILPRGRPPSAAWPRTNDGQGLGGQSRPPSRRRTCRQSCLRLRGAVSAPDGLPSALCTYEPSPHDSAGGPPMLQSCPRPPLHAQAPTLTLTPLSLHASSPPAGTPLGAISICVPKQTSSETRLPCLISSQGPEHALQPCGATAQADPHWLLLRPTWGRATQGSPAPRSTFHPQRPAQAA